MSSAGSMSPKAATAPPRCSGLVAKAKTQLNRTCDELIETESTYVSILETIVDVYLVPLRAWAKEDASKSTSANEVDSITPAEVERLFGSVETLLNINRDLLDKLRTPTGLVAPDDPAARAAALAKTLATAAAGPLRFYAPHVQSFTEVCALLRRLLTERPRFAAAARVLELQPRSKGLSLQGLLVNTVQRLPRYVLLLRELLQHATVPGVVPTLSSGSPGAAVAYTLTLTLTLALTLTLTLTATLDPDPDPGPDLDPDPYPNPNQGRAARVHCTRWRRPSRDSNPSPFC